MKSLKILAAPLAFAAGLALALPAQAAPSQRHSQQADWQRDNRQHDSQLRDARSQHGPRQDSWRLTPARNAQIRQEINALRTAIDRAAARRAISQREAAGLRKDALAVQRLHSSYARNGLTRTEVRNLESRVNSIRVALRMERRDWDGRRG